MVSSMARAPWLARTPASFDDFLALTRWEVEREANRLRATSAAGATWDGLSKLMERRSYVVVNEIGLDAARAWAAHLGIAGAEPARNTTFTLP
jgi:hypothetical protein